MQNLDVISINFWQVLVSLLNLVLLFLIIKRFFYQPVKKMMHMRQKKIDDQIASAESAEKAALNNKKAYEEKLAEAEAEADGILRSAIARAHQREEEIVSDAKERAQKIIRQAETEAEREKLRLKDSIKQEIVQISTLLAAKLLKREVSADDHKQLIHSFIDGIGDDHESNS